MKVIVTDEKLFAIDSTHGERRDPDRFCNQFQLLDRGSTDPRSRKMMCTSPEKNSLDRFLGFWGRFARRAGRGLLGDL